MRLDCIDPQRSVASRAKQNYVTAPLFNSLASAGEGWKNFPSSGVLPERIKHAINVEETAQLSERSLIHPPVKKVLVDFSDAGRLNSTARLLWSPVPRETLDSPCKPQCTNLIGSCTMHNERSPERNADFYLNL